MEEEEKKIESEESEKPTTVTFDLGIVAFFTALGSLALNLIFIFIFLCGATGAARAFDIIEIIVFIAAVTFYVIPMFKDRKVKLDGTLVLLLLSALTMLRF